MHFFKILGIEPTKDEIAIKEAYLSKLSETNPEDKPNEFMELRKAYEDAVDYASQDEEDDEFWEEKGYEKYIDDTEIGQWMADVIEVYKSFKRRNDLDEWKRLLNYDVCQNIVSKIDARSALITFFTENYNMPANVIRLLNEHFDFEENLQELYEEFPQIFIDNAIMYFLEKDEFPKFSFFGEIVEGLDYDRFLNEFYYINRAENNQSLEEIYDMLQELKEYGIYHPEVAKKEAYILYYLDEIDKALELLDDISPEYREEKDGLLRGYICSDRGDYDSAEKHYLDILEDNPNSHTATLELVKLYRKQGKLLLAREHLNNLIGMGNRSDGEIQNLHEHLNKEIIEEYEESISKLQDKYDDKELIEISNIYYMLNDLEPAKNILENIEITDENDLMVYRMKARINLIENKFDEAMKLVDKWEESIKNSSKDKLEKFQDKYVNLGTIHYYRAIIYNHMSENDKAIEELDTAIENYTLDIEYLNMKTFILQSYGRYEEAIEVCNKILDMNPNSADANIIKIESLYELGQFNELFELCNKIIYRDPTNLFVYAYQIRVLIDVDELENAKEILDDITSRGANGSDIEFLQAYIYEKEGKIQKAREIYSILMKNIMGEEGPDNFSFVDELYFRYVNIVFDELKEEDYNKILDIIEEGLKYNPIFDKLLYYKALIFTNTGRYDEAIETYKAIEKVKPNNGYTDRFIGDNYNYKDMEVEALEYYNRHIQKNKDDLECYFRRIHINLNNLNIEEVSYDLDYLSREIDYDDPRLYEYLGYYYNLIDEPKQSYKYFVKAKNIYENPNDSIYYLDNMLGTVCAKLNMRYESNQYFFSHYELTGDPGTLLDIYNNYVMIGDFVHAERILKKYFRDAKVSRQSSTYLSYMANLDIEKRNINGALKNFSLATALSPEQKKDKARALFFTGQSKKALDLIEEAIYDLGMDYNLDAYYILAGKICLDLGYNKKAHEYANKAIEIKSEGDFKSKRSKLPNYYDILGSAYTILGEYDKAMEYLNKALTEPRCFFCADTKCIEAMCSIAYLEYVKGNLEKAKELIREILEIDVSRTDAILLAYKTVLK